MNARLHAALPGLSVRWETIGYKQAAPTELFTCRPLVNRAAFFKHFELLADQPDAVGSAQLPHLPQLQRSDLFIEIHHPVNPAP